MTLGAGPLIWLFNNITPYYKFHPDREGSPIFSLYYNVWYCIGALLYQGRPQHFYYEMFRFRMKQ